MKALCLKKDPIDMTIVLHLFFGLNASSLGLWLFKVLIGWVFLVSCHVTAASCL